MQVVESVQSLREVISSVRAKGKRVGFVPTMGNLHAGHLALVKRAHEHADYVAVSIYVNPTQFGADEDLDNYPSTIEEDKAALIEKGADLLFLPTTEEMYPGKMEDQTVVQVPKLSDLYCGKDRPVHFYGVTTVVSRLFNMVQPDVAVFGKKDYQQLALIRKMVHDLAYPVEIIGLETERNEHGLALSSRNGYLSEAEMAIAPLLQQSLREIATEIKSKGADKTLFRQLEESTKAKLAKAGFEPHYIVICRQSDLQPAGDGDRKLVVLAAALLGKARLIDNLEVLV